MGDLTPAELVALAEVLAGEADRLSGTFARELADVLQRVERRLPVVLADAQAGGIAAAGQAATLGRLRANLRRLLTEAGYDDLIDASITTSLDRTLATLARRSEAYQRALAFDTTGRPTAFTGVLRALVETGRQDLLLHGDQMAVTLWRATVRGVLGGDDPTVIVAQLARVLDGDRAKAATLYDTNVSIVQRVSVQTVVPTLDTDVTDPTAPPPLATGGDVLPIPDDQLYAYVGPVDGIIRPFCLAHVGRVYTKAEIDALDNDQLPNAFLTGGGYNCRHLWAPISRFSASADLHGTDGRLPEVEADLARATTVRGTDERRRSGPRRLRAS
jgi:hypothetical protein